MSLESLYLTSPLTKEKCCKVLNLDFARKNLEFSRQEINSAYKKRMLRVHPDKQTDSDKPIPAEVCKRLVNDVVRAKTFMLTGKDDNPLTPSDVLFSSLNEAITKLNHSKISDVTLTITVLSWMSNYLFLNILLSWFKNNTLILHIINKETTKLNKMRRLMPRSLAPICGQILRDLKSLLVRKEPINRQGVEGLLKNIPLELQIYITQNRSLDDLIATINDSKQKLIELLSDDLIRNVEHIIYFGVNQINSGINWKHILGVYFISSLFSSTSLLKYLNATLNILEIIWTQKGRISFCVSLIPIAILSTIMLPLNFAIQFGCYFVALFFRMTFLAISETFSILTSLLKLFLPIFQKKYSPSENLLQLVTSLYNLLFGLLLKPLWDTIEQCSFYFLNTYIYKSNSTNNQHSQFNPFTQERASQQHQLVLFKGASQHHKGNTSSPRGEAFFSDKDAVERSPFNQEEEWLKELENWLSDSSTARP